jgi:aminodeoxyfutalosine synthase
MDDEYEGLLYNSVMTKTVTTSPQLADIAAKVEAGERLTYEDACRLYDSPDIHAIGSMADTVRRRMHGNAAYYNINRHINYSNYCVLRCKFCSFYRPFDKSKQQSPTGGNGHGRESAMDDGGGYELSLEEVVGRSVEAYQQGATEVHIVGGLHPKLTFSYYTDLCSAIRDACPGLHIKAFTAIEIIHFSRIARPRLSIREVLEHLRDAGLGSMPGGGAEIFDDRVHDEAFKNKVGEAEWFDVHRTAHDLGIFTNATMLYGHIEAPHERIAHMVKLREHQDASLANRAAHFNTFIPLSFIPEGSELDHIPGPTGLDDLKTLALARLMLDNVPHIKAFWIMHSAKLAQVALNWGVDDIDGTVVYYDITKREGGGTTHQELTVDRLKRLIREAGCEPVERDTLYRRVLRTENEWWIDGDAQRYDYGMPIKISGSSLPIIG